MTNAPAEMNGIERDEFLGTGGSGVLSLASDDAGSAPHSLPVSYGYDAEDEAFFFRLAVGSGSEKPDLDDRAASFVSYGHEDGGWRSVVATGRLESTSKKSISTDALGELERVFIPLVDIFGEQPADVQFEFFRLLPESFTTRKEASTEV